jgi:hypothetical protein
MDTMSNTIKTITAITKSTGHHSTKTITDVTMIMNIMDTAQKCWTSLSFRIRQIIPPEKFGSGAFWKVGSRPRTNLQFRIPNTGLYFNTSPDLSDIYTRFVFNFFPLSKPTYSLAIPNTVSNRQNVIDWRWLLWNTRCHRSYWALFSNLTLHWQRCFLI